MTNEELHNVVDLTVARTIERLKKEGFISGGDADYRRTGDILKRYYAGEPIGEGLTKQRISYAIASIQSDAYYEIIPLYYGDGASMERVAEYFGCDVTTVSRNKKRLVIAIANAL